MFGLAFAASCAGIRALWEAFLASLKWPAQISYSPPGVLFRISLVSVLGSGCG